MTGPSPARAATIAIHEMRDADRPAVVGMIANLSRHEIAFEADRTWLSGPPFEETAEIHVARLLIDIDKHGGVILVATHPTAADPAPAREPPIQPEAPPVGFAAVLYLVDEPFVAPHLRRHAYISDLYVSDGARGTGVARALVDETVVRCRAENIHRIGIGALALNEDAHAAYARLGFRAYAIQYVRDLSIE